MTSSCTRLPGSSTRRRRRSNARSRRLPNKTVYARISAAGHALEPLALDDRMRIDPHDSRVDRIPIHRLRHGKPCFAVAPAKVWIAGISGERIGEFIDLFGVDDRAGHAGADDAGRSARL